MNARQLAMIPAVISALPSACHGPAPKTPAPPTKKSNDGAAADKSSCASKGGGKSSCG